MIQALIFVDVPFYREGLAALLNKSAEVKVVATVSTLAEAERVVANQCPDVVLIDASLSEAVAAIERMCSGTSPTKFVVLAVSETPDTVLKLAELGAAAYVPRSAMPEDLLRVIKGVVQEEFYCTPQIAARLLNRVAVLTSASRRVDDALGQLSRREHEVLLLMARGLPNKAIANHLSISHATAKNHVHHILEKLNLQRRSEVASLVHGESLRR